MERKIAEISLRIYGHAVDLAIVFVTPIVILAILGYDSSKAEGGIFYVQMGFSVLIYCILSIAEGFGGRTPGKYFAETRVVTTKGNFINVGQSILRNILRVADFFGFYILGLIIMRFSRYRQRIGDHVARTLVIYEGNDPEYDEDNKMQTITVNYPDQKKVAVEEESEVEDKSEKNDE